MVPDHGVEDDDELAHAGDQTNLAGLVGQTFGKSLMIGFRWSLPWPPCRGRCGQEHVTTWHWAYNGKDDTFAPFPWKGRRANYRR